MFLHHLNSLYIYINCTDEIWVRTENAGMYKSSTVLDLVGGRPLEMRYLFGVPLERARLIFYLYLLLYIIKNCFFLHIINGSLI